MSNKDICFDNRYIQENLTFLLSVMEPRGGRPHIHFCTDDYNNYPQCSFDDYMTESAVKKLIEKGEIKTRTAKSKEIQQMRTKEKAEVFTPGWICEYMVNSCIVNNKDLTMEEVNNKMNELIYVSDWTEEQYNSFIKKRWLEACCGEAPYIVSRYDTTTGEDIDVYNRTGFLDRKLQLISRYRNNFEEWFNDVVIAYKNTYAYEWQGDNLFIARCNLLLTFLDYYKECFGDDAETKSMSEIVGWIAEIIMKNTVQMDGLTWKKPCSEENVYFFDWSRYRTAWKERTCIPYSEIYEKAIKNNPEYEDKLKSKIKAEKEVNQNQFSMF